MHVDINTLLAISPRDVKDGGKVLRFMAIWSCLYLAFAVKLAEAAPLDVTLVKDSALLKCIQTNMHKNNWSTADQVNKLKCHNKGIASLRGIGQLENLKSLSLFNNRIQSADVTQLKQLTMLNLANNDLVDLQIAGLANLKTLFLFKNQLKTVDMTGLASLTKLRMMQNKLIILDITPLQSLKEAHLFDNELKDLQIAGLHHLEFLDVKQNPMPDELYDFYDEQTGIVISHDGNADDWQ